MLLSARDLREDQEKFFSEWLVVYPSGQVLGCSTYSSAREIAIEWCRNKDRHTKLFPHESPVWNWFGLSYSAYLVAPRAVLCAMPQEWQERFVGLLKELDETLDWEDSGADYTVQKRDERGRFISDEFANYRRFDRTLIKDKRK